MAFSSNFGTFVARNPTDLTGDRLCKIRLVPFF